MRTPDDIIHRHNQLVAIARGESDCPGMELAENQIWLTTAIEALAWVAGQDDGRFAAAIQAIDLIAPGPTGLIVRKPELREVVILDAAGRPARAAEAEMACEVCGCSEFSACKTPEGPCHWVSPNLCSACAEVLPDGRHSPPPSLPGRQERARL